MAKGANCRGTGPLVQAEFSAVQTSEIFAAGEDGSENLAFWHRAPPHIQSEIENPKSKIGCVETLPCPQSPARLNLLQRMLFR